jgi:site-specific recombinase XerD
MKEQTHEPSTSQRKPDKLNGFVDDQLFLSVSPSTAEQYREAFLQDLHEGRAMRASKLDRLEQAWSRFAFAVICFGGVCGTDVFQRLVQMQWSDIWVARDGYLWIPRAGGRVPVFIEPTVQVCAMSLCLNTMRKRGAGPNHLGVCSESDYLLPIDNVGNQRPGKRELGHARSIFRQWQTNLTECYQLPAVSIDQLIGIARWRLRDIYSPPIAATLIGMLLYNPILIGQGDVLADFRRPFRLPAWSLGIELKNQKTARWRISRVKLQDAQTSLKSSHNDRLRELYQIIGRYVRLTKAEARTERRRITQRLKTLAQNLKQHIDSDSVACNAFWLMCWAINLMPKSRNTVASYLGDARSIVVNHPSKRFNELTWQDWAILLEREQSVLTRNRRIEAFKSLHRFLTDEMKIQMQPVLWSRLKGQRIIRPVRLITSPEVERLLNAFVRLGRPQADVGYVATLLAFFFGLRISEVCHLKIGDVWLHNTPVVFAWNSKRNKSRAVTGLHLPAEVKKYLAEFWKRQLIEAKGDRNRWILMNPQETREKPVRRLWLLTQMKRAMRLAELNELNQDEVLVFHSLRHGFANRLWALGVSLLDITRLLGHNSVETTLGNYLHIVPWVQREQLTRHVDPLLNEVRFQTFSLRAGSVLFGVTERGFVATMKRLGIDSGKNADGSKRRNVYNADVLRAMVVEIEIALKRAKHQKEQNGDTRYPNLEREIF